MKTTLTFLRRDGEDSRHVFDTKMQNNYNPIKVSLWFVYDI